MTEPTTVRDIEWHVRDILDTSWVYAEDQCLFGAGPYAQQVTFEHNGYQAMRERLAALVERGSLRGEQGQCLFCGTGTGFYVVPHDPDCVWLLAKQLLDALTVSPESA